MPAHSFDSDRHHRSQCQIVECGNALERGIDHGRVREVYCVGRYRINCCDDDIGADPCLNNPSERWTVLETTAFQQLIELLMAQGVTVDARHLHLRCFYRRVDYSCCAVDNPIIGVVVGGKA